MHKHQPAAEWPTILILIATYGLWGLATTLVWDWSPVLSVVLASLCVAQHSSLTHEALHGHPTQSDPLNQALVFPALGLFYPYGRFRDLHLAHHHDPDLTDPYDDPESNYLDPAVWARLSGPVRALLRFNNTLLGRLVVGTAIGVFSFWREEMRLMRRGDRAVLRDWGLHAAGLALVGLWLGMVAMMPFWAYLPAAYAGNALIKVRTFAEHRAHASFRARTVVVEDRGPLAFLFLNNNFHVVHHMHPTVAWHRLPVLYRQNRDHYLRRNEAYVFRSYAEIFRHYFLRTKDPVPHPLWTGEDQVSRRNAGTDPRLSKNGTPG